MNRPARTVLACLIVMGAPLTVFSQEIAGPVKSAVATFNLREAIVNSKEGRGEVARLRSSWAPELEAFEKRHADLDAASARLALESKRSLGCWPWSRARNRRQRLAERLEIDRNAKALAQDEERDRSIIGLDQTRVLQRLGPQMLAVVRQYAKDHGYFLVVDVSSGENPVLVGPDEPADVTDEIVRSYDEVYPGLP